MPVVQGCVLKCLEALQKKQQFKLVVLTGLSQQKRKRKPLGGNLADKKEQLQ